MKRFLVVLLKTMIGCGLLVIAYELLIWAHPPSLAWGLSAAGRNAHCGALGGYRGLVEQANQRAMAAGLAKRLTPGKKESGLKQLFTPQGEFWIPEGSEQVLPVLLAQQQAGIYGEIRPGEVVLDCGAHVGTFARQALRAGAGLVVAIEPAPDNVECLRRAFSGDIAAGRLIVVSKGVWDRDDSLPLYADPANSAADSFIIRGPRDRVIDRIPLTTIDRIVQDLKLSKVTLIKMDIKGATLRALAGASEVLNSHRPRLAISTEEEADAPADVIAGVGRLAPGYQARCGICSVNPGLRLIPDVLFFDRRPGA